MNREGVYLYCLARPGSWSALPASGVDERHAPDGIEAGQTAAVFSRICADEFTGELGERNVQDPAWVVPRACRHERVVEEVMRRSPVLPVRFGSVFLSIEALAGFLERHSDRISAFLERMSDKEEWALKGMVCAKKVLAWVTANDPALTEAYAKMPETPGARYLGEKRLRAQAERQAQAWCADLAERVDNELEEYATDVRALRPRRDRTAAENGEMVFNRAFLIPRGALAGFRDRVRSLENEYADAGVSLEASGPWPPYNFCPSLAQTTT